VLAHRQVEKLVSVKAVGGEAIDDEVEAQRQRGEQEWKCELPVYS
jgi:hypothetical protein